MSVLIKGMEMPTMCSNCDFCGGLIMPDGIYCCDCPSPKMRGKDITKAVDEDYRHPDCPLVEVPTPHGRLVDLDAMIDEFWDGYYMEIHCKDLDSITVIMEAEKEKEE